MRRTVKVSFKPRPRLPITTPVKIWMRSLSPSTTLVCTRTVSPTPKSTGFLRNCSDSILSSIAWFIIKVCWGAGVVERCRRARPFSTNPLLHDSITPLFHQHVRPLLFGPVPGLFRAPSGDFRVVAGEQHFRHLHPAELRRPPVLRIFQRSVAERFVARTF